jgi:predicted transposase/invertase (TIGR01784 family)
MPRYLNPYTDFGFKKLFGEEANKDLLLDFLNQLLPPEHQIAELAFRNAEQLPDLSPERRAIFDISCVSTAGERFIVEMQKAKIHFFKDRALFYSTFPIREQAQKGPWSFRLDPIYFVAILDFEYDEHEEERLFRRDVVLRDQTGSVFFERLHFKFLQMPLFDKQEDELETHFDKWCYFLKHLENFDRIPAILNEPVFQKAFSVAELANLSREQFSAYEQNLLDYWGVKAAVDTARDEGREEGREVGREEGLEEGIKKGAEQRAAATARKMLAKGYSPAEIAELTGLDPDAIGRLGPAASEDA